MRVFRVLMALIGIGLVGESVAAQEARPWDYGRSEFVIVSGGPALRRWEDLRIVREQHDRWWGNFIRAARIRIEQIRRAHGDAAQITWLVYRPGYERRVPEDAARNADQPCTIEKIVSVRDAYRLKLIWFSSANEVVAYLNSRPRHSIIDFEYFGHSNRDCFMFDYSAEISGVSTAFLHETELNRIRGSAFNKAATIRSWGCHTGESMCNYWRRAVGVPMEGVIGKTDYSVIIDHKSLPKLSGPNARWTR
jgi:hypothetical protein